MFRPIKPATFIEGFGIENYIAIDRVVDSGIVSGKILSDIR